MAQLKKHMHVTETTLGEQKVFIPKDLTDKAAEIWINAWFSSLPMKHSVTSSFTCGYKVAKYKNILLLHFYKNLRVFITGNIPVFLQIEMIH